MKKLLALVLALVMSMSLVTISNAAFKDADSIDYQEAVDILNAVGVLIGDENGNFNAKAELTRGQAAKIIAYLDLGGKTADAIKGSGAVFTDVKATDWFAGYVEYCAGAGYVAGMGDKTFAPNEKVTGVQFAKMLLCALGYKAEIEGYNGTDYTIAVARDANKNNLFDDLSIVTSANLTREQAAQMAFNALEANVVEYQGGTNVTTSDGTTVVVNAERNEVSYAKSKDYAGRDGGNGSNDTDEKQQLCEKLYGKDLKKTAGETDDLGRPASKWSYKGEEIGTYGDTADEVYVLAKPYVVTDKASLLTVLKDKDLTDNSKLKLPETESVYVNGTEVDNEYKSAKAAFNNQNKGGVVVELFYNDDDSNTVDRVVVLNYSINQIDDVSTKLTKDQKDDGATCKIKIKNASTYTDDKIADFDAKTYVEDAYLLYIVKDGEIVASQIAQEITGTVTAIKGSDKATVGGTTYKFITMKDGDNKTVAMVTIDIDDEGSFYLNAAGQIAAVDTTSKSDDYAYIYTTNEEEDRNSDGVTSNIFTVYYVTVDGVKASAVVNEDDVDALKAKLTPVKDEQKIVAYTGVVAYSIDSDKEFNLETAKDDIDTMDKAIDKSHANGTDSDTKFIFAYREEGKKTYKTSVSVGYKNVNIDQQVTYTVTNKDGDIIYVFVGDDNGTLSSDTKYAVVKSGDATRTKDGDDTIYTYSVVIDGEETTLSSKKDALSLKKGEVFSYEMDGKYIKKDSVDKMKFVKVTNGTKDYIAIGENQYNLSDADAIYTVTLEYKTEAAYKTAIGANTAGTELGLANLDTVSVSEGADVDNDSWVAYKLDGKDLDILFVVDFVY